MVRRIANLQKQLDCATLKEEKDLIKTQINGCRKVATRKAQSLYKENKILPSGVKNGVLNSYNGAIDAYLELVKSNNNTRYPKTFTNEFMTLNASKQYGFFFLTKEGNYYIFLNMFSNRDIKQNKVVTDLTGYIPVGATRPNKRTKKDTSTVTIIEVPAKTNAGLLFQLNYGYHIVQKYVKNGGIPKSVQIIKKKDRYFAQVAFEFYFNPRSYKNYIGIDRGINNLAAFSIISPNGVLLKKGIFSGEALKKHQQGQMENRKRLQQLGKQVKGNLTKKKADQEIEIISAAICSEALRYNAIPIWESLSIGNNSTTKRSFRSKRAGINKLINKAQYSKLQKRTMDKLTIKGALDSLEISPAYTSQTCSKCGYCDTKNRNGSVFNCKKCGHEDDADSNASTNIAFRGLYFDEKKKEGTAYKKGVWKNFEFWFEEKVRKAID